MKRRVDIILLLWFLFSLSSMVTACDTQEKADSATREMPGIPKLSGNTTKDTLALVNGVPILRDDLDFVLDDPSNTLSFNDALQKLIEAELLAQEASKRGWGWRREVALERKKALAAAIIRKTASQITADKLDETMLKKKYEQNIARFVHGPTRLVVHVVAKTGKKGMSEDDAHFAARTVYEVCQNIDNEESFRSEVKKLKKEKNWVLKIEKLPPFTGDSSDFEKTFVDAAFQIQHVGDISTPVKTTYGWHVILLLGEQPAVDTPFEGAKKILAEEILPGLREKKVSEMIEKLFNSSDIFFYGDWLGDEEIR